MHSPSQALVWELGYRHRWALTATLVYLLLLIVLCPAIPWRAPYWIRRGGGLSGLFSGQVEEQDFRRLASDELQALFATGGGAVAFAERRPVQGQRAACDVDPCVASGAQSERAALARLDERQPEVGVLVHVQALLAAVLGGQ